MSRGGKARQSSLQLDTFRNADPLVGIFDASALVIETAITDNAQPFNQPWPPTGLGDGWHAVDKFSSRRRTFWRRIRLEHTRPSPRGRPIHR